MSAAASLPHDAARQHVSGSARYVDDIPTPQGTLHLAFGLSSCAAGQMVAVGHHQKDRLPGIMNPAIGEEWLVMGGGGDIIGMGKILGRQHQMNPGAGAHSIEIH